MGRSIGNKSLEENLGFLGVPQIQAGAGQKNRIYHIQFH